jgi:hypothetical protein
MKFSLKLIETDKQIRQKVMKILQPEMAKFLKGIVPKLKSKIVPIVTTAIVSSPEYESILNGKLKYEFGIPDSYLKLEGLLSIWLNNISITYNPPKISNNFVLSSISINMIKADFSDVLGSDYAQVIDTNRGYGLFWLEWLLLDGRKTIVKDREVTLGPSKYSRTGFALMTESARDWSVPSEYAGTIKDNWITRAIDNAAEDVNSLLKDVIK